MKKVLFLLCFVVMTTFSSVVHSESIIYLIDDYAMLPIDNVTFNGESIDIVKREVKKKISGVSYYKKAYTKCTVKNDGRLIITRDYWSFSKQYHAELILDVVDGETYYLQLIGKRNNDIKILKAKGGEKSIRRAERDKDWQIKETTYEN